MIFDLGKQKKEQKGLDPPQLRSYFQASGRNAFRILSGGPSRAHMEAWANEGIDGPNTDYNEGGFLLIRVDSNDADDFDSTNVIVVAREGDDAFSQEAVKVLDALEQKHAASQSE